jgi:hypothetical protein
MKYLDKGSRRDSLDEVNLCAVIAMRMCVGPQGFIAPTLSLPVLTGQGSLNGLAKSP